ncbi:MAG: rod-binding protein [Fervidobacterium sp.]|uniref:rod-binding protein n=1 Tax=Fervidobacterium sp. TaxID=1871331 RepID=UPI004049DBE3
MGIDIKKVEQLTKNFNSPEYQKQLRKVSEEFAAWYVYEVFKKMYDTVPKSGLLQESFGERWFREMLLQQYALKAARTDLKDLSDMIYRSLGGKAMSEDVNSAKSLENKMNMLNALNSLISQNKESGE